MSVISDLTAFFLTLRRRPSLYSTLYSANPTKSLLSPSPSLLHSSVTKRANNFSQSFCIENSHVKDLYIKAPGIFTVKPLLVTLLATFLVTLSVTPSVHAQSNAALNVNEPAYIPIYELDHDDYADNASVNVSNDRSNSSSTNARLANNQANNHVQPENIRNIRNYLLNEANSFMNPASCSVSNSTATANSEVLTLSQAIQIAVARHPSIQTSIASHEATLSQIKVERAAYFPQISAGITGLGYSSLNKERALGGNLRLVQKLYDFGKTRYSVETVHAEADAKNIEIEAMRETIARQVALLYSQILRLKENMHWQDVNVKNLNYFREKSEERFNAGTASRSDISLADIRLAQVRANREAARANLQSHTSRLEILLGQKINQLEPIPCAWLNQMADKQPTDWNTLPAAITARHRIDSAIANAKKAQASIFPELNLVARHNEPRLFQGPRKIKQFLGNIETDDENTKRESTLSFEFNAPLYQGGAGVAQAQVARASLTMRRKEFNALIVDLREKFATSQAELLGARQKEAAYKTQLHAAADTIDLFFQEYDTGKRNLNNLLDAQRDALDAGNNVIAELFEQYRHAIDIAAYYHALHQMDSTTPAPTLAAPVLVLPKTAPADVSATTSAAAATAAVATTAATAPLANTSAAAPIQNTLLDNLENNSQHNFDQQAAVNVNTDAATNPSDISTQRVPSLVIHPDGHLETNVTLSASN